MKDPVDILLVEDNPNDVRLTLSALKESNAGAQIHVVRDGQEALDFVFGEGAYAGRDAARDRPKVILLDLKLPKIKGTAVLKRIKEDERTRSIPVIVLTSSQEERDLVESYHFGSNSYVVKPMDYDEFVSAIKELKLYWLIRNKQPAAPGGDGRHG